jgi:cytochrome c-type biogenesis protein CcmH
VKGWSLLARSMNALGRYAEAADAYEHLTKLVPNNADVLADYADSLAMKQGRDLSGKPYALVKQALKIDPAHQKALALAGTAAMNEGDYASSLRYWQALGAQVPPGSEDAAKVDGIIAEVRSRAATTGKPLASGPASPAPRVAQAPPRASAQPPAASAQPAAPAAIGPTVSGTVTIADTLAPKVAITDTLFIFARSEGGPRIPLAVYRGGARELPKAFVLDDSMSMAPGMKISTAQQVRIEARVSKSGNATPQPGDLVGSSAVVKPGARDVKIVIDRVVP